MEELPLFLEQVSSKKISLRKLGKSNLLAALKNEALCQQLDTNTVLLESSIDSTKSRLALQLQNAC